MANEKVRNLTQQIAEVATDQGERSALSDEHPILQRLKREPNPDLVQIGFRCERGLKKRVDRLCVEHEITVQTFGQMALQLLVEELERR